MDCHMQSQSAEGHNHDHALAKRPTVCQLDHQRSIHMIQKYYMLLFLKDLTLWHEYCIYLLSQNIQETEPWDLFLDCVM